MKKTWVLVADRCGAKFYEHLGLASGLKLIEEIEHPEGSLRNQDIDSDRAAASNIGSPGKRPHGYSPEVDAKSHVLQLFTKQLAEKVFEHFHQKHFEGIVLVAEPRFLGSLREALSHFPMVPVVGELNKDLSHLAERDLPSHIVPIIQYQGA